MARWTISGKRRGVNKNSKVVLAVWGLFYKSVIALLVLSKPQTDILYQVTQRNQDIQYQ